MKSLTITFAPAAQAPSQNFVYYDVSSWDWDQMRGLHISLDDGSQILFNTTYVIAVFEKEELEPEEPQLYDIDEDD